MVGEGYGHRHAYSDSCPILKLLILHLLCKEAVECCLDIALKLPPLDSVELEVCCQAVTPALLGPGAP